MSDPATTQLIETLRKAVSRTSMMAEGTDPQLDLALKEIRQTITSNSDANAISAVLKASEPKLIKADEARDFRAKKLRDTLHDLIDLLERLPSHTVPQKQKKDLLTKIRSQWQSISHWPELVESSISLIEATLLVDNEAKNGKRSLFKKLFSKNGNESTIAEKNVSGILLDVSQTLTSLLDNLSLPENFDDQISDVKLFLNDSRSLEHIPKMVAETTNLAMIALGKNQQDLTSYLSQLNSQLASINAGIVTSYKSQRTLTSTRHDFNSELQKQVSETTTAVTQATDLGSLKNLIETKLETISSTMDTYQKQMLDQEKQASQSISQLRNKVSRMEKDASTLRLNLQQKLAQAMTDSLTNLPNRAAYQDSILPICNMNKKARTHLALAVCDIDHFKSVNDTWGHLAGDKVLRLIPRQIRSALTEKDMAFRYGGEEFVILLPDTTLETAKMKMEAIRQAVEKMPFNVQGVPVPITISIGIALLKADETHEGLFERADKSLYLAKEQGRNRAIFAQT
ncbi:GGDEF domain-containing protein [Marinomonas sp. 15G1-11]|uniref:diguanylate cyclase n=1 Tax=Marinomonas phaeophyticola TaxID=3004091 RepID=A0ABT4JYU8_9GAMM|nr:GGDEF domain-containing protein [Marinomonas sp. 15G1-11]MCZ2723576.1 GGDEF domain-containing protein [Marinomonas sp. 15G1-11]